MRAPARPAPAAGRRTGRAPTARSRSPRAGVREDQVAGVRDGEIVPAGPGFQREPWEPNSPLIPTATVRRSAAARGRRRGCLGRARAGRSQRRSITGRRPRACTPLGASPWIIQSAPRNGSGKIRNSDRRCWRRARPTGRNGPPNPDADAEDPGDQALARASGDAKWAASRSRAAPAEPSRADQRQGGSPGR